MGKGETQGMNAVQMATGVALGGLLALGVELILLLLGAAAVSRGILKDSAAPQLTAAACVLGCFAGGLLACARWKSRRLLGGLAAGAVCYLLILAVGLLMSEALALGGQALVELAGCFHRFYNACRIKGEEPALLAARLKLADATRLILKNGLQLLGVDAPEKM